MDRHTEVYGIVDWRSGALILAGFIGSATAAIHAVVTQRLMVRPIEKFVVAEHRVSGPVARLIPVLLHLSSVSWLLGGVVLIAAGLWFGKEARFATAIVVGSLYLYGMLANLWATRGNHPGWALMAAALFLILIGTRTHAG